MSTAQTRPPKLAVVGASGTVGSQIVELIEARSLAYSELKLFASERCSSEALEAEERRHPIFELTGPAELAGFDIAFLAVPQNAASGIIRARPGPVLIDLSGAMRAPSSTPMGTPGLTPRERISGLASGNVFEIPHPATHVLATILSALGSTTGPVAATIMMGASSRGRDEINRLAGETTDLLNARLNLAEDEVQRAFNVFLSSAEKDIARVIQAQVAHLLGQVPKLSVQAVRMPVFHGTAIAACVFSDGGTDKWLERIRNAPGLLLLDEADPTGVIDAAGEDAVLVKASLRPDAMDMWCVFDNARLAALEALWFAETLGGATNLA
jgi:aspartate-semialdehyde dehydrogenase